MDERSVDDRGRTFVRTLRGLDAIAVPSLAQLRAPRQRHRSAAASGFLGVAVGAAVIMLALVTGAQLAAWRDQRAAASATPIANSSALASLPPSSTPPSASVPGALAIPCPSGLEPELSVATFPTAETHGAVSADAAFVATHPGVAHQLYPLGGTSPKAPVWIVAGGQTYLATVLPDGSWFLSSATLVRCADPYARATPGSDPVKEQTPPPGYTIPPAPRRFDARTPAAVRAGLQSDPFVGPLPPGTTFGDPVYVPALRPTQQDEWLVPLVRDGQVGGVVAVTLFADGSGSAAISTGWAGPFPHALSPEEAAAKINSGTDPAVGVQLVWAVVDPRQGGPASQVLPLYAITLRSGARWYVFNNGAAVAASIVDAVP